MRWPVLAILCLLPATSHAYERTRNPATGLGIEWGAKEATYYVEAEGTDTIPGHEELDAVRRGFDAWSHVHCLGMSLRYGGTRPSLESSNLRSKSPESAVLWVHSNWSGDPGAIALTYVEYTSKSGTITSADMTFNLVNHTYAASSTGTAGKFDLQSVATHEAGHFLGLAHSLDPKATMWAKIVPGSTTARSLSSDDENGACVVAPMPSETDTQDTSHDIGCSASQSPTMVALMALSALLRRRPHR